MASPTARAKYATDHGSAAKKTTVLATVIRQYPSLVVSGNDTADTLTLAAIGARLIRRPLYEPIPKTPADALTKAVSLSAAEQTQNVPASVRARGPALA